MKEKRNNFSKILKKIEKIEKELLEVKNELAESLIPEVNISDSTKENEMDFTIDDLYEAFGRKNKSYAVRLRNALEKNGITTLAQFLSMTNGQLFNLDGIGFGTLQHTSKAMKKLGIKW